MSNEAFIKNEVVADSDSIETLSKRQEDAIEAFSIVFKVCQTENIQFFLLAGSCLGAIRNNGMIPWDDDIDIGLKLDEYERLKNILPTALKGTKYEFCDNQITSDFPKMYGKILKDGYGVVDIFKLVPVSDSILMQTIHWYRKRFWNGMRSHSLWRQNYFINQGGRLTDNLKVIVLLPFTKLFSLKYMTNKLEDLEKLYCDIKPKFYSNFFSIYSRRKELINAEWLENPKYIMFENMECPIVSEPDAYLRKLYGNYMTPPVETKQVSKHLFNKFK